MVTKKKMNTSIFFLGNCMTVTEGHSIINPTSTNAAPGKHPHLKQAPSLTEVLFISLKPKNRNYIYSYFGIS